uniref:ARAD1B18458p n=1 Tax=Blastobotrys adeninivorans TaxID=409370 RepID=A0A060TBY9_BLAAD
MNGTIINSFFNWWKGNTPGLVKKEADSTFIPSFRHELCYVFGQQMIPTFIMELADSQSVDSLLTAVISWLCRTLLLV